MSTKAVKERDMENVQSVGLGWVKLDRITMDPEVMGGQPCLKGLRIPVSLISHIKDSLDKCCIVVIDDYRIRIRELPVL